MLRQAGAEEVHLRITAPPTIASCYYGVDTPTADELIATRLSVSDIAEALSADSLAYISIAGLRRVEGEDQGRFCEACFTADYPVDPRPERLQRQMPLFVDGGSADDR